MTTIEEADRYPAEGRGYPILTLHLQVTSGKVICGGLLLESPHQWWIQLGAQLAYGHKPATGEAPDEIFVNLKPISASDFLTKRGKHWQGAVGAIWCGGGSTVLEFYLGEPDMTRLLEFARAGRLPRLISAGMDRTMSEARDSESPTPLFGSLQFEIPIDAL